MICKFLVILIFVLQIFILGCGDNINFSDPPPDIQPSLHDDGRHAEWKSQNIKLSKTGFVASIGPYYYTDDNDSIPDYYSIEVSKSYNNAWRVYLRRDYHIKDLPNGFLDKPIDEIVKYDEDSRIVTFIIGDKKIQYALSANYSTRKDPTLSAPPSDVLEYDGGIIPDIGEQLQEEGRPCEWKSSQIDLDKTGYKASVGPVIYQNKLNSIPDFYSIDIEKKSNSGRLVYFRRNYHIKDLPNGFWEKPIDEIVKYDEDSRMVTFIIGDKKIQYKLPSSGTNR